MTSLSGLHILGRLKTKVQPKSNLDDDLILPELNRLKRKRGISKFTEYETISGFVSLVVSV